MISIKYLLVILSVIPFVELDQDYDYLFQTDRRRSGELDKLAKQNLDNVKQDGSCKIPKLQVVYPHENDSSKTYLPRGTLLFQCNDQVGCCDHPTQQCEAVQFETIKVAFLVTKLSDRRTRPKAQLMDMQNHTKCGCVSNHNYENNFIDQIKDNQVDEDNEDDDYQI